MKKTLLPLILVTLLSNITISYAQGNQPFWKITGNTNITSENFIGTLNNQNLVFKTNNTQRMLIQENGLILFKNKVTGEYPVRLKSKLTVDGIALFKDKATFNGIGHFKNKLIADDITRLKSKLIVDSNAVIKGKIRNNYLSGSGIVLLKADNNGVIKKFLFPGDSTKVLRGNGTYGSFSAGITGSENNTVYFNPEGKQQESDALTNDGTDIKVKNNLTVGERSGATGAYSMVVGASAPEYGLAAPEASNLAAFAHGSGTKATGIASFSTGVTTKATGVASFSIGINTIASGESSFAGGHDDAGGNRFVVASGKGAFNYSAIGNDYIRVGAAAKNSAILGGKDNSIDTLAENSGIFCGRNNTILVSPTQAPPLQTVIIGGENIIATEANTVYVPDLIAMGSITAENMNVTGQTVFDSLLVKNKIKIGNSILIQDIYEATGDVNYIYTDNDKPLHIQNDNIDHNTIINAKNKGLVGIGTTEPTAKLNISGIVFGNDPKPLFRITENTTIISAPISSANIFEIKKKALTMEGWSDYYALTVADTGNVGIGTNDPHQRLHVNGYSYFDGNVGIGTDSPQELLHIEGESGKLRVGENDKYINIGHNGAHNIIDSRGPEDSGNLLINWYSGKDVAVGGGGWYDDLLPNTGTFTTTHSTYLATIDGKVGIGITNPQQNLHIKGITDAEDWTSDDWEIHLHDDVASTILRIEDNVINSMYGNRNVWWDMIVSGVSKKLYIKRQSSEEPAKNIMTLTEDGNVGIGTSNPENKLDINGSVFIQGEGNVWTSNAHWNVVLKTPLASAAWRSSIPSNVNNKYLGFGMTNSGWYWIMSDADDNTQPAEYPMFLSLSAPGVSPQCQLNVDGYIKTRKVIVDNNSWGDFVFDGNYKRMSYEEKEKFYIKNKHLFGMPSGKQIEKNGLDVGETMKGVTLNVEENRLDITDLHKRLLKLEKENKELKKEISKLKNK